MAESDEGSEGGAEAEAAVEEAAVPVGVALGAKTAPVADAEDVVAAAEVELELLPAMSVHANRPLNWNLLVVDARDPGRIDRHLAVSKRAREVGGRVVIVDRSGTTISDSRCVAVAMAVVPNSRWSASSSISPSKASLIRLPRE